MPVASEGLSGFPTKNVIILVVTVGVDISYDVMINSFRQTRSASCHHSPEEVRKIIGFLRRGVQGEGVTGEP